MLSKVILVGLEELGVTQLNPSDFYLADRAQHVHYVILYSLLLLLLLILLILFIVILLTIIHLAHLLKVEVVIHSQFYVMQSDAAILFEQILEDLLNVPYRLRLYL
jgi:hypothetical protein